MYEQILNRLDVIESLLKDGLSEKPLTFNEAADYLGLSKSFLYKLTSSNRVPCYKPEGKKLYFSKPELDAWLMRNPVKTETEIEQEANDWLTNGRKRGEQ